MGEHQGRFLYLLNDLRHRIGLTTTGHPLEGLASIPIKQALTQCLDRFALVSRWFIGRSYLEWFALEGNLSMDIVDSFTTPTFININRIFHLIVPMRSHAALFVQSAQLPSSLHSRHD